MQVGKIEICGRVTGPHISIRVCPMPSDQKTRQALEELALSVLLSGHGAKLIRNDDLVPCFDEEELRRRNAMKRRP